MIKANIIILAGGLASRLKKITLKKPKSLIKINGKPFILRQLDFLENQGFKKIILSIGHHGDQIQKYLNKNYKKKISISYLKDKPFQLGTGGAVINALNQLGKYFFIIYGDSYLRANLKKMESTYIKKKPKILMGVYKNNNKFDKSNIIINKKKELYYDKKNFKKNMKYIDYGVSIVNSSVFKQFKKKKYYDLSDIFHYFSLRNDIIGIPFKKRFFEIGSKKGIIEANKYFKKLEKKK